MASFIKMGIHLNYELIGKLTDASKKQGVTPKTYAEVLLSQALCVPQVFTTREARPIGRPVKPEHEDLSSRIERAETSSGFVGVYARGNRWTARWLHEELGLFSSREMAAIVRFWFEQGRRSVARDTLIASGASRAEATRLSRFQGDGEPLVIPEATTLGANTALPSLEAANTPVKRPRGRPRGPVRIAPDVPLVDASDIAAVPCQTFTSVREALEASLAAAAFAEVMAAAAQDASDFYGSPPSQYDHVYEVQGCTENEDGSSDTTNDEPPPAGKPTPGGKGSPASGTILRWSADFRQVAPPGHEAGEDPGEESP